jgi:bacillithiol biosynthesis deacetylase BshB1
LQPSREQVEAIVAEIRRWQPRIVFAPYWVDRHPDHTACSKLIEEAVFNAKLRHYMPDLPAAQVDQLFYYYINDMENVSLVVDVTSSYEAKRNALRAYRSQFDRSAIGNSVETPLTNGYLERVEARDYLLGQSRGWSYAEGFAIKKPYGVSLF